MLKKPGSQSHALVKALLKKCWKTFPTGKYGKFKNIKRKTGPYGEFKTSLKKTGTYGDVPLYITENGTSDRLGNTDDLARWMSKHQINITNAAKTYKHHIPYISNIAPTALQCDIKEEHPFSRFFFTIIALPVAGSMCTSTISIRCQRMFVFRFTQNF